MQVSMWELHRHQGVRQFAKFAIVGASSAIIDFGVHWLLFKVIDGNLTNLLRHNVFALWPALKKSSLDPAFIIIKAISFICATLNGFYWNRRWTFRASEGKRHAQLGRFYVVYIIGLLINTTIASMIYHPSGGKVRYALSLIIATIITTGWTFPANKFWTFGAPRVKND